MPATVRPLPESIGRYQIQSLIGRGGMGEVYKAFDPKLDRLVALKTIRWENQEPAIVERLYREARACGRLDHHGIVRVYDVSEEHGFVAMEFLEGESLEAAIDRGSLSFERKLTILADILEALQYAHSQGVIHRDVKPTNVHVLPDGRVKLLDFGLARVTRADSLTMTGTVMGTPYYMSPEQLKGQVVDERADVYSTGVLAYELLTRRKPFDGEGLTEVMLKVLSDDPPPMATTWSGKFPRIEQIISRALAKSVDQRFVSAGEMRLEILRLVESGRDAIRAAQDDVAADARRTISEVRTLISGGRLSESLTVLDTALRSNPDAVDVRALRDQTRRTLGCSSADEPVATGGDVPIAIKTIVTPYRDRASSEYGVAVERPASPASPPAPRTELTATTSTPSRGAGHRRHLAWWVTPAAAVVLISGVALFAALVPSGVDERREQPTTTPEKRRDAVLSVPADSDPNTAVGVTTGDPLARVAEAQSAPKETTAPSGNSQQAQPTSGATTDAVPQSSRPVPAVQTRAGVFIDVGTDSAVVAELGRALSARGVTIATSPARAQLVVSARVTVTTRRSPFGDTSATTGDFVGTLTIRNVVTGTRQTQALEGHALEFGEDVVRAVAFRRAAEEMAETIAGTSN
jgi:serine/threonine protein kinase